MPPSRALSFTCGSLEFILIYKLLYSFQTVMDNFLAIIHFEFWCHVSLGMLREDRWLLFR